MTVSKKLLSSLTKKYNLPAFGIVKYKNGSIEPYVYVLKTDSMFKETACGSGSIAASIVMKKMKSFSPQVKKYMSA